MRKKVRLRIWIIVIMVCVISFWDWTFAEETAWDWNFEILWFGLKYIITALIWIWVFLAKIAWTFLTNKRIYGESLQLDSLLWKFWNIIKNVANFWLWFYLVYIIFKWLIKQWKENITKSLKDTVVWLLIAWVWIQASWFLTAAVIDVSTITLAAAWSFPSQVVSENPYVQGSVRETLTSYFWDDWNGKINMWKEITVFSKNQYVSNYIQTNTVELAAPVEKEALIDSIMPNSEDVSWPLYFMWFSILNSPQIPNIETSSPDSIKKTIFNFIMVWWTTIVFSIEMFVLCVLALMRTIYLRMFIVLSPLAIFIWCIEQSGQKLSWNSENKSISSFLKALSLKTFFVNVFKPTIIVLWLWLAVIFTSLMKRVVIQSADTEFDYQWIRFSSSQDSEISGQNPTYTTKADSKFLQFTLSGAWKTLLELVISIMTIILVYQIIQFAVKMWWWDDFISKRINKVQEWITWVMNSLPVVPVSWYDEKWNPETHWISAWKTFGIGDRNRWNNLVTQRANNYNSKVIEKTNKDEQYVKDLLGMSTWYLSEAEKRQIGASIDDRNNVTFKTLEEMKSKIEKIKANPDNIWWKWMTLNGSGDSSKFWVERFEKWLTGMQGQRIDTGNPSANIWRQMIERWNNPKNENNRNLATMFKEVENSEKAYAEFFWYGTQDYSDIMSLDISKK